MSSPIRNLWYVKNGEVQVARSRPSQPAIEAYAQKTLEQVLKNRWQLATGLPWTKKSFIKVWLGFQSPGATRQELEELVQQIQQFQGGKI